MIIERLSQEHRNIETLLTVLERELEVGQARDALGLAGAERFGPGTSTSDDTESNASRTSIAANIKLAAKARARHRADPVFFDVSVPLAWRERAHGDRAPDGHAARCVVSTDVPGRHRRVSRQVIFSVL